MLDTQRLNVFKTVIFEMDHGDGEWGIGVRKELNFSPNETKIGFFPVKGFIKFCF